MMENESLQTTQSRNDSIENIRLLYKENAIYTRYHVDWRYKIIVLFLTSSAILMSVAIWIAETKNATFEGFLFLPFLLGLILTILFFLMEKRNIGIMRMCQKVGKNLEEKLFTDGAHYFGVEKIAKNRISYTMILNVMYGFFIIFFTIMTFILLFR